VCSAVEEELVDIVSAVVFSSLGFVVLVSEKTVAVIVW
jgi:pyrroline-5-carboxylate reductase